MNIYNFRKNQIQKRQNQAARKIQQFLRQSKNGYVKIISHYTHVRLLYYHIIYYYAENVLPENSYMYNKSCKVFKYIFHVLESV